MYLMGRLKHQKHVELKEHVSPIESMPVLLFSGWNRKHILFILSLAWFAYGIQINDNACPS